MNFISDAERAQIAKEISKAALPALNQREREYTQKLTSILSVQRETILTSRLRKHRMMKQKSSYK